jgi:glycopeptide antibiotics resistance protein
VPQSLNAGYSLGPLILVAVMPAALGGSLLFFQSRGGAPLKLALRRSLLDALLVLSILLILIVTLLPQHGLGGRRVSLIPFHDISRAIRDGTVRGNGLLAVLGNLLLFTPLGFVGAIRWASLARPHRMAILAALSSSMLELVQFFMGGRSSSIDDVILNTAGALLGVVVARTGRRHQGLGFPK